MDAQISPAPAAATTSTTSYPQSSGTRQSCGIADSDGAPNSSRGVVYDASGGEGNGCGAGGTACFYVSPAWQLDVSAHVALMEEVAAMDLR